MSPLTRPIRVLARRSRRSIQIIQLAIWDDLRNHSIQDGKDGRREGEVL